jgi:hypothetical protein
VCFGNSQKGSWQHEKIRYDKDNQELATHVVSQWRGEMRGACLLSRRSEDVLIFFGRANVHCEDLLDYWFH